MPIYATICQFSAGKWHSKGKKYSRRMLGKPINMAFFNGFKIKVFLLREKRF